MIKKQLLILLILLSSLAGYSQTITPQWKGLSGGVSEFHPGKTPPGFDSLMYVSWLRGVFKIQADTNGNNGYVTNYGLIHAPHIWYGDQTVHGNIIVPDANKGIVFDNGGINNSPEELTINLGKKNGLDITYFGNTLARFSGPGHSGDIGYIKFEAPLSIPNGFSPGDYAPGSYDVAIKLNSLAGPDAGKISTVPFNTFSTAVHADSIAAAKIDTSSQNQRPYRILYNKTTWNSLSDFATPTATVSIVSNKLSFSGGVSDFTKTLNLSSYTMLDKQSITVAGIPQSTSSSFGVTTGSGSPLIALFNRTGTSGTIELYAGNSILVAASQPLTFSVNDRIIISLERDGTYAKATAYNQTTRSNNVVAYYNYNTTITSNPLLPRTGQIGIVSYSGAFTVDSIRYATDAIKNAQIAVMGTSKSQYYDISDVSRGYVTILGSKYGNVLQHSGQSDATAQALLSLPELIAFSPKIVLDEMECNDVRLGVPIATTMANVRNYTAQLNAAGIIVYHLLPFYEKVGTGGAVNLQPMVDSLKAAFPTTYIDTYTPTYNCASCIAADGVHLTDEGNSVIANTIINYFNNNIKPGKNINQSFQAFKGITTQSFIINDNITSSSTAGTNYLNSLVNAYPTGNAFTSFSVGQNSSNQYLAMTYENSTFVTSGVNQPNTGYIVTGSSATGGLVLSVTGNNTLKYATNGLFRGGISGAGNFLFGTNTDASTGVIQATGNVAITGNINATSYSAINSTSTITSTGNSINNFSAINSGTASNQFLKGRVNNVDVFAAGWDLSTNSVYSGAIDSRIYALRTANTDRLQISAGGLITVPGLNTAGIVTTNSAGTFSVSTAVPTGFGGTGQTTYTNGQLLIGNTTGSTLNKATLTGSAATGLVVTNGPGSITLSNDTIGGLRTIANSYSLSGMQTKLNNYVLGSRTLTINGITQDLSANRTFTISTNPNHTIFTPTTGGAVTLVNNQYNIINPAGSLLALTVNLPSSPANNDTVQIKFTQAVTTVTYSGGTVADGITSPIAGGYVIFTFDSSTNTWY